MSTTILATTLAALISLVGTIVGTGLYRKAAIAKGMIDHPNERSSHKQPTPTGGGVVAVVFILALWVFAYFMGWITLKEKIALIIPGLLIAITGFLDDRKPLKKRWRFGIQIIAVTIVIALLYPLAPLPLWPGLALNLNSWALPLVAVAMLWLINLYNFMDGIDGLAASEAITVLVSVAIISSLAGSPTMALLCLSTLAPLIGFLLWNWAPAKIFMGDACSTFLGISLATLALISANSATINLWCWAILLAGFIVDASYTLLVRMLTHQAWRSPHRSHLYQKLASSKALHARTTLHYCAYNLLILLPAALLVQFCWHNLGPLLFVVGTLPIIWLAHQKQAGLPEQAANRHQEVR
ncbi:glycosyltransferase family 4 protein [Halioxenophilus sp. WMMB6]|uniref:MraY family glycosyltransferase n=1 Tax=Halioxenophilus sp. WMMB6 TaxID=3073815 RepID=UPI00295E5BC1|nr:glycosyltransferase family 4 protein [Halioxenophilus sp. WMMB6]